MRGAKETRNCAACGKSLTRLVSQARGKYWYCDNRCQASHAPSPVTKIRTVKLERVCACGRSFTTYPSVNQRHCSQQCSSRFVPRRQRTGKTVACETCGSRFYQNVTEARRGRARFCSMACRNASQSQKVTKACVVCGKEMRLAPSKAGIRTCSRACMGLASIRRPLDRLHNGKPARLDRHGYVLVWEPEHSNRNFKGWQHEHRLVAERALGRLLTSAEHVDHINRLRDDNRPENLQVLTASEHARKTGADTHRQSVELIAYRRKYGPLD